MANGFFVIRLSSATIQTSAEPCCRRRASREATEVHISILLHRGCLSFNSSKPLAVACFAQDHRMESHMLQHCKTKPAFVPSSLSFEALEPDVHDCDNMRFRV